MLDFLTIKGGAALCGEVRVSGAKNSALPLLIATLLTKEPCVIHNIPDLEDISVTLRLLSSFGAKYKFVGNTLTIETPEIKKVEAPYSLVKAMRASFWVLGPLLARAGRAEVALPGGDAIGTRPVDLHLKALSQMGADIRLKHGVIIASVPGKLEPAKVAFDFASVGATHQALMAAALTEGETIIEGAAREPEVVELAAMLSQMGAQIEGAGESTIRIVGRRELGGANITVLGDRIEAATYLISGAMTQGDVTVSGISPSAFESTLCVLEEAGATITRGSNYVGASSRTRLRAVNFETAPFPGVATDIQPMLMAAMIRAEGVSKITETVFENRFGHVAEYRRFGADISIEGREATIIGVSKLSGAPVEVHDIRAGAGLVLLGMCAEGETTLTDIHHLDRGYESLVERFSKLGAAIKRTPSYEVRELVLGC